MNYFIIDSDFLDLDSFQKGLQKIFVEIDDKGRVNREIGFDFDNQIIHVYPSKKYSYGKYGIFDLCTFDASFIKDSQLSKEEFNKIWDANLN